MTRPIPLAPRPFPDESVRSWIGRVAARYDLSPPALVAQLRDGQAVPVSRLASLDWQEDAALEHLLARATHLDRARIRRLRLVTEDGPKAALWHRPLLAWCPTCACEDIARHGETYERAVWHLGCCAACPTHRLVLADVCPACAYGRVGFQAVAGRQRLVCGLCKQPVDAPALGRETGIPVDLRSRFAFAQCREWTDLALALQAVLLGLTAGSAATGPWQIDVPASRIAVVIRDLAAALLWPELSGPGSMDGQNPCTVARDHVFAILAPRTAYEVLGIIASVLTAVAGRVPLRMPAGQIAGREPSGEVVDLKWFIHRLPATEQQWLKARASGWGPILARVVGDAVDVAEEADRRRATATREQARRDKAWLRHASVKYANDARRRIAARAANRQAVVLKRKQDQASSVVPGHLR